MTFQTESAEILKGRLRQIIQESNLTPSAWAREHNIEPELVNLALRPNGRPPGPTVLSAMGIVRRVVYEELQK